MCLAVFRLFVLAEVEVRDVRCKMEEGRWKMFLSGSKVGNN